jgi:murein DD-endopeptidase MepM/ murein hydrolase activator NlpD
MHKIVLFIFLPLLLGAATVQELKWSPGETYLMFLERLNLPKDLYYKIDKEDQKLTEEIITGIRYQVLRDSNDTVEQVLIPVNDELQLHLYRDRKNSFAFEAIPIVSNTKRESVVLTIEKNPYEDILKATGSKRLAQAFVNSFKNSLNFRRDLRKGDPLVMIYDQKYRLGKPFSMPVLQVAMIEMRKKRHYVFLNSDGRYYDENGAQVEGFLLARPVRNARISSKFTKRRYHPILKRYRAHLGIDYAARRGTPIMAAGSGKIIFAGRTRGYGNLIKIRHSDGYMTLYAHQKSFKRGIRKGKYVKQGQVIGYVGTTGLSTGPHLHFGLYKNGRAINPARVVRVTTKKLSGKKRKAFLKVKKELIALVDETMQNSGSPVKYESFNSTCYVDIQDFKRVEVDG